MKKAIFAGSFDPLHEGHKFIIKQALKQFDFIYVVVAINWQKRNKANLSKRFLLTQKLLAEYKNIKVIKLEKGYVANLAKELKVEYLIRGIRNKVDMNYEDHIKEINDKHNKDLKTVYIITDNKHAHLSSSKIRA